MNPIRQGGGVKTRRRWLLGVLCCGACWVSPAEPVNQEEIRLLEQAFRVCLQGVEWPEHVM